MPASSPSSEQKYTQTQGRAFLSGNQILVRVMLEQARRDREARVKSAGFVSGYRGSPLGRLDQEFWEVKDLLDTHGIRFQPAVNEDLAVTALWGTQEVGFFDAKVDGVFGLFYAKSPGVDRSCDALRHANLWGTSPRGGVIMAVGDDPMGRSSLIQSQSEHTMAGLSIPVFHAANVQDLYDFGLTGLALSRYAGVWCALKAVSDIFESWYAVDVASPASRARLPADHRIGPAGVHIRWPDRSVDQDERLLRVRLPAVRAFARSNGFDRVTHASGRRRLGIVTTGKSWSDTVEALMDLGLSARQLDEAGVEVYKVGLVWPLEAEGLRAFAAGLEEILIIEECRPILEPQIKDALYDLPADVRPRLLGKRGRDGAEWMPSHGELDPALLAHVLNDWLKPYHSSSAMAERIAFLDQTRARLSQSPPTVIRTPHYCSGCPHNSSTKVPEGSQQMAGIGCHYLVTLMDREAVTYSHMGGEGVNWVGAAPFVNRPHMFVNLGDGTYYHSGSLAIRQAVAAKVNVTYKILFNDAVAMTGGQPVDGPISVEQITEELHGAGVAAVAVVSSNPAQYAKAPFAPRTRLLHRDELDRIQREFRETEGVTAIIYEQTCATELRRRRKRKKAPEPAQRVVINDRVCEGCGDCSVQSNCLSVQPLETEFGRKRTIDQSACNKDLSCLKGFCPSLVTVEGGQLKKGKSVAMDLSLIEGLPEPEVVSAAASVVGILVAGIGGTGVVTLSNLIGAAAQAEGKVIQALDLTGMAQKFGAVYSHLKVAERFEDLAAPRLSAGQAQVLIGADLVTSGGEEALSRLHPGITRAIVNAHETVTGAFTRDPDFTVPRDALCHAIEASTGPGRAHFHDVSELAWRLTGDTIGANIMLLGFASQSGWLPVRAASLEAAIVTHGVAVAYNVRAFKLGRLLAFAPDQVMGLVAAADAPRASLRLSQSLDERIRRRVADLTLYQNAAYAARYRALVEAVRSAESALGPGHSGLTEAVAKNFHKLMAYKDEYEVARLFTDGEFTRSVADLFSGKPRLVFHMAPPLFAKTDPATGRPVKKAYGPGTMLAFKVLARMKGVRGTALDPFGYNAERKAERALIGEYERTIQDVIARLTPANHRVAVLLAEVPAKIRGFGPVKMAAMAQAEGERQRWLAEFGRHGGAYPDEDAVPDLEKLAAE